MHPLLTALLGAWEVRWEVLLPLLLAALVYGLGWTRLRLQSRRQKLASR